MDGNGDVMIGKERSWYNSSISSRLNPLLREYFKRYESGGNLPEIVGVSPQMQKVYELMALAASSKDTNVNVYGETGTGKGLIAETIHRISARRNGEFVTIYHGTIPDQLLGSELLGYLFIDELDDIGKPMRLALLKAANLLGINLSTIYRLTKKRRINSYEFKK